MIDLEHESLIPLREVPQHLPPRPTGRRLHVSAVYRWVLRGVRGVCLEATKIGGTTYTSKEALQRFADQLSAARSALAVALPTAPVARRRQIERAAREAQRILDTASRHGKGQPPQSG